MAIIFIISFIVSVIVINGIQNIFMRILGINVMAINIKTKVFFIIMLALVIAGSTASCLGISQ